MLFTQLHCQHKLMFHKGRLSKHQKKIIDFVKKGDKIVFDKQHLIEFSILKKAS